MSDKAKPDVPPPRYEPVAGASYKILVMDEQEWLARPASWGIGKLSHEACERKRNFYDYHHHRRLSQFVPCEVCRHAFAELISEESIIFDGDAPALRQRYSELHPVGAPRCAAWPVWAASLNYARGIVCQAEAHNGIWDSLFGIAHSASRSARMEPDWKAWERALALELVGPNPFRPIAFSPEWRTDTAASLARHMYESHEFGAMPILADALQDAGCDSDPILNHCRSEGPHVRGCWVVDLVLGKA